MLQLIFSDFQPGRVVESLVFLFVLWRKVGPHLKRVEDRLEGLEKAVAAGFSSGEARFINIEDRITVLENTKGDSSS